MQTEIHKDIIEKCKRGNAQAQYKLYNQYARAMYNICKRMMSSHEEAQDLLQESFSDAFAKLHSFRYDSTFGAWIKRIVINKCINEINRRKVDLDFTSTDYYVVAQTQFSSNKGAFWGEVSDLANTIFSRSNRTQINYKVYMPENCPLTIENKFSNVYIGDQKERADIVISNGDLKANQFHSELKLEIDMVAMVP